MVVAYMCCMLVLTRPVGTKNCTLQSGGIMLDVVGHSLPECLVQIKMKKPLILPLYHFNCNLFWK